MATSPSFLIPPVITTTTATELCHLWHLPKRLMHSFFRVFLLISWDIMEQMHYYFLYAVSDVNYHLRPCCVRVQLHFCFVVALCRVVRRWRWGWYKWGILSMDVSECLVKCKILKASSNTILCWSQYKSPYILIGLSPCYE